MLMHRLVEIGASRHPDRLAFWWADRDRALTYAQAVEAMESMAGALAHLGVRPGDRVLLFANNGLDYLVSLLGCWRTGAIPALVNLRYAADLAWYVADHRPSVAIYTHEMEAVVRAAAAAVPELVHRVCMDGPQPGAWSLPELLAARLPAPPDPGDERAIAHLSYTSGTTGRPKGACLAHEPTVTACRCIAERLRLRPGDRSLGPTALSSSYQLVANILPPLAVGGTVGVMGRWSGAAGLAALEAFDAAMLVGNPVLLAELLEAADAAGRLPPRLRLLLTGGGPLPPALRRAWRDCWRLPLVESYGQSEIGGFFALGFPELETDDAKLARIGPALPDKEVVVLGPDDRELPPGEVGEVALRGGFMVGYWGRPEATAAATRGGWLRSGDLGVLDCDGYLTMRGRVSEVLTVDGRRWFPRDVEEALAAVPGVALTALVGVPAEGGTRPVAFVTARPGATLDPPSLRRAIAAALDHELDRLEIRVVAELPTTPTGKIAKAELAALAAAG